MVHKFKEEIINNYRAIKDRLEYHLKESDLYGLNFVDNGDVHLNIIIGGTETEAYWYDIHCGQVFKLNITKLGYEYISQGVITGNCSLEKYQTKHEISDALKRFKVGIPSFDIPELFFLEIGGPVNIEILFSKIKLICRIEK